MPDISLSMDRYSQLVDAERKLAELPREYDKAEECGVDCQSLRNVHALAIEQIAALKKNYTPHKAKATYNSEQ